MGGLHRAQLHSQHNSIWTCHISSAHFNSLHVATIQDDTASEDSTSRLETQNTDIKARATVQQHVTRVLNNEHVTQSPHQIPKLLTYKLCNILRFLFFQHRNVSKAKASMEEKKQNYRAVPQSKLYFCSLLCCKKPSKSFLA